MKKYLSNKKTDLGLLILRTGIGFQLIMHGLPKITKGPEMWTKLGGAMKHLGIDFAPTFWGFMASAAEFGGGILLILGLFSRPTAFLVGFTMLVAAIVHWSEPDATYMSAGNAVELMIVSIGYYFTGPGKYSLDSKLFHKYL